MLFDLLVDMHDYVPPPPLPPPSTSTPPALPERPRYPSSSSEVFPFLLSPLFALLCSFYILDIIYIFYMFQILFILILFYIIINSSLVLPSSIEERM